MEMLDVVRLNDKISDGFVVMEKHIVEKKAI